MLTSVYRVIWRHRWLVLLQTVLVVGVVWFLTSRQTKEYTASTTVRVQQRVADASDVFGALQTGERLARTYVAIAKTSTIRDEVRKRLGDSVPGDAINVDANQVNNLELLRLSVTYREPRVATRVANAVPEALEEFIRKTGTARDSITVVEPAGVPSAPSSPNVKLNIAAALLVGLILSCGVVLLVETFSDRIEDADDLERLTHHPVIATIPALKFASSLRDVLPRDLVAEQEVAAESTPLKLAQAQAATTRRRPRAVQPAATPTPAAAQVAVTQRPGRQGLVDPSAPSAEPFRTLRLAFQLRAEPGKGMTVLFTSAEAGAGKSTLAANFAVVSALGRARVLLVDADLRRPVQHEIFGLRRAPGLVELLAHGGSLERYVQRGAGIVDVLCAGSAVARASDVLASSRMSDVLADTAKRYDVVVVDASPVLAAADAEGMAARADLDVAFVVDRRSRRRSVVTSVRRLERLEARIAGVILNREGTQEVYGY